jgi:outer membrane protein
LMTATQRADLEREFTARSREFRRAQESFTEDLNVRRNEELAKLQRLINDAIIDLARDRNIDLILTERNVLYASDRIDITDDVIAAMQRLR